MVTPGVRSTISSVRLDFAGDLSRDEGDRPARLAALREAWGLPVGQPFRQADWDAAKQRVLDALSAREYAAAAITDSEALIDPATASAALSVTVDSVPVPRSDLALPADGRLSSRFGLRRVFNGEPRAPHTGLDVAVPTGTPIRAPADGVVTLVDDFYFNGKTVFVDHGQSFVSMVCHLDRAGVEAGQTVRRGEVLGHSGSSGRATGPHLHWSVYLNGAAVDPALFIGPRPAH